MKLNKLNDKEVLVVVIVWKLPFSEKDELTSQLIELGDIILQVEMVFNIINALLMVESL